MPEQEQSKQLIDQLVQQVGRWRLSLPSLLLLEVVKPFSFFASQGLLLCQPLLGFLDIEAQIAGYADLLADRSNVERLITRFEHELSTRSKNGIEEG
jgi:hypothetical protein